MDMQQPPPRLPKIKFRVLIIGRANAGKTSILQRVCDTTQSPTIIRRMGGRKKQVQLDPSMDRGEHRIEDELVFSNHDGYIFHDSCGFEAGDDEELKKVQNFVQQKSREKKLTNRLHAIWYCVPMDNQRPELDLKYFRDICPDRNVAIIGVFTKYDQFRRNIKMHLQDHQNENPDGNPADVADGRFEEDYVRPLGEGATFVRLEKMHKPGRCCKGLIEKTAGALNDDVVTLMLLAVQRSNLELSVNIAMKRIHRYFEDDGKDREKIVEICLIPFPYIWLWLDDFSSSDFSLDDLDDLASSDFSSDDVSSSVYYYDFLVVIQHIMSMPIFKKFSTANNARHHLVIALLTVLKHATTLRASGLSCKLALAQAGLDHQQSNLEHKAASYFTGPPQMYSVQQFVDFIMGVHLSLTDP